MAAELFWLWVSALGAPEVWFSLSLAFFIICGGLEHRMTPLKRRKCRERSRLLFLSVLVAIGLSLLLKAALTHPRPCVPCSWPSEGNCNPFCPTGTWPEDYSFPSAHAAVAFAAVSAVYASMRKKKYALMFIFPALVGLSRMALGVHTVWDVLAGAALGLLATDAAEIALSRKPGKKH